MKAMNSLIHNFLSVRKTIRSKLNFFELDRILFFFYFCTCLNPISLVVNNHQINRQMNLSYLPLLASGKVPENDLQYKDLNEARRKRVIGFVKSIPQKYNLKDVNADIEKLSSMKDNFIYKVVDKFQFFLVIIGFLFFVLYWILFGFGWGLITGGGLLILLGLLDSRLGNLFELTPTSIQLLTEYDSLINALYNAQKREQKNNK